MGVPIPMRSANALDPIWGGQNMGIKWRGVKPYGYGVSKGGGSIRGQSTCPLWESVKGHLCHDCWLVGCGTGTCYHMGAAAH